MPSPANNGAILLGHGSREPATEAEIKALCAALAKTASDWKFAHAFLNQPPKLGDAVTSLAGNGCAHIRVLPLLVFTGHHVIEDVPAEVERLRALHPGIRIELEPHLFRQPGFAALIAESLNKPGNAGSPA